MEMVEMSPVSLAKSAIWAGHVGKVTTASMTAREKREIVDRGEAVLSDFKNDPPTAAEWFSFWGTPSMESTSVDAILGAGTPLIGLYLFGWCFGKHWIGWVVGSVPVVAIWASFIRFTFVNSDRFAQLWTDDIIISISSCIFYYMRIRGRTPREFPKTRGLFIALFIEAILGNMFTYVGLIVTVLLDDWYALSRFGDIMRLVTFTSPVLAYISLQDMVFDRQAAVLRKYNMGNSMALSRSSEHPTPVVVCRYLMKIIDRSRDLRVTGLSAIELDKLAEMLIEKGHVDVAGFIRFYTRGAGPVNTFDRLYAFHRGYMYKIRSGRSDANLRTWVNFNATHHHDDGPLEAILRIRDSTGTAMQAPTFNLMAIGSAPKRSDREGQNWWLCGAIAKARDEGIFTASVDRSRRLWYALMAAALCADRDAVAVVRAMTLDKNRASDAQLVLSTMMSGYEQMLRLITDDIDIYENRGLTITTANPWSSPERTFSAAEVWQAELNREPIVIGKDTFSMLWAAEPELLCGQSPGALSARRSAILHDSARWYSKTVIYVNLAITAALSIDPSSNIMANIRSTAWRGWIMHCQWEVSAILIHFLFPHRLLFMAALSAASTMAYWKALYIHCVFIGFHMWRTPIGRICLLFPAMSDASIHTMSWCTFFTSIATANWLTLYVGMQQTSWARYCFFLLMFLSFLPGLRHLACANHRQDGLVKYVGRSRGPGYEHRKDPAHRRPLGTDAVIEQPDGSYEVLPREPRRVARESHRRIEEANRVV